MKFSFAYSFSLHEHPHFIKVEELTLYLQS